MPSLFSLEPLYLHHGVYPLPSMLSLWSPSLSSKCGSCSPWLSPPSWCGALDWWLCFFSFWQRRLRCTCQLLSLLHQGHSFLFSRPSMLKLLCWSLHHFASSLLVLAAPTSLPFLFSYLTLALSSPPRPLLHISFYLSVFWQGTVFSPCSIRLQWVFGHSFLLGNDVVDELARRGALLAPSAILCNLSLLLLVSTLVFSQTGGILSHLNSLTHSFPRFPLRNLCSLVMLAVPSLVYAAKDTAFC